MPRDDGHDRSVDEDRPNWRQGIIVNAFIPLKTNNMFQSQYTMFVSRRRVPEGAFPHAAVTADHSHTIPTAPVIFHQKVPHQR
jgi:hypothetical protein